MKWVLASLVIAFPAMAESDFGGCNDVYSDCHDNCSLKFGTSMRDTDRIKLGTCINKCQAAEQDCRDRYLDTQVHQLSDGALKNAQGRPDDDLREDNRKHDIVDDGSSSSKGSGDKAQTKKKNDTQRDEDLPKRTSTRAADLDPKPAPAAKEDGKTASATPTTATTTTTTTGTTTTGTSTSTTPTTTSGSTEPAAQKKSGLDSSVREEDDKQASTKKTSDSDKKKSSKRERPLDEWDPEQ